MKKILYFLCNFTWGGVEQYVLNVLDNIDRSKFQIDILLPRNVEYDREDALSNRNVTVYKLKTSKQLDRINEFKRLVKEQSYDIVHLQLGHEAALWSLVCHSTRTKVIVHSHATLSGDENTNRLHLLKKKIFFSLSEIIFKRTSTCVACSEDAAIFMFGEKNRNVKILNNGINLDRFYEVVRSADIDRTRIKICINARFDMPKNPFFVIDVINEMVKIDSRVELEWLGNGVLENQIKEKIKECRLEEHIKLVGTTNDVPSFLSRNDYFFLPSLCEGLGIVLIEAQATGMKCFISDAVPLSANCGGCIVIPLKSSAKEWAEIMYREMNRAEPADIDRDLLNQFDIKYTVKELEAFYESI